VNDANLLFESVDEYSNENEEEEEDNETESVLIDDKCFLVCSVSEPALHEFK
jgi:hypothetical protein